MFGLFSGIVSIVAKSVSVIMGLSPVILGKMLDILISIIKGLGIVSPTDKEDIEDLGDRALQAEEKGIKPENYDSYEEYLKAIKEIEIDEEKSASINGKRKIEKGVEVVTAILVEKYGEEIVAFVELVARNPQYFDGRISYFAEMQKTNPNTFSDITRYIEGKEVNMDRADETLGKMYDVEKKVNKEASLEDMMAEIEKLKD